MVEFVRIRSIKELNDDPEVYIDDQQHYQHFDESYTLPIYMIQQLSGIHFVYPRGASYISVEGWTVEPWMVVPIRKQRW